jgi:phage baseplate assembly protein W
MIGTDAKTGKALNGIAHLRQSVTDILSTPIGSRVLRRTYGSQLFQLIDKPLNRSTVMDLIAATADALQRWEKRFKLKQVTVASSRPGAVTLDITGVYLPDGKVVTLAGIEVT